MSRERTRSNHHGLPAEQHITNEVPPSLGRRTQLPGKPAWRAGLSSSTRLQRPSTARRGAAGTAVRRQQRDGPRDGLRGLENGASNPSLQSSRSHSLFSDLDLLRQTARAISNSSGKNKSSHRPCRAEELPQGGSKPDAARVVRTLLRPRGSEAGRCCRRRRVRTAAPPRRD